MGTRPLANRRPPRAVGKSTERISEQHVAEPGLVVLDITGGDEDTVVAVMTALDGLWATSGIVPVRREPAEPGVRARMYADVLRPGRSQPTTRQNPSSCS
ncbi:DUF6207 family protein [Streptomyces scopuliridis]|uniref:DUF6207 family protein n=1 Tax=Streptomyces scopuliridis TaxID=452529 RepID=UPI0036907C66